MTCYRLDDWSFIIRSQLQFLCTMTGYSTHKQYSIILSTSGYMTSGWAPVPQV